MLKVKKALEKSDRETARIHAQNAIRMKTSANNYLRLSSRLEQWRLVWSLPSR